MSISLLNFSFMSILSTVFYILLALVALLSMVTIHELGHYTFGKLLKFKINEFSVGFGKALYSKTKANGEKFSLRLIPLGGYCAFEGEDEDSKNPLAFNNQKPWKRLIVQFGGVLFNFISAILFSAILLTSVGYINVTEIDTISTSSLYASNAAVLEVGDVIYGANDESFTYFSTDNISTVMAQTEIGETINLMIERDGEKMVVTVTKIDSGTLDTENKPIGVIGIELLRHRFNIFESFIRAFPLAISFAWQVLASIWLLITGAIPLSGVTGPITTIAAIANYTQASFANLLFLLPFISANLAIFNALPFPALDGARMVFTGIEWIRKKPISRKVEGMIHFVGLIILFSFVIFVDIIHLF